MSHILPGIAFALFIVAHFLALVFCTYDTTEDESQRENKTQHQQDQSHASWQSFSDL